MPMSDPAYFAAFKNLDSSRTRLAVALRQRASRRLAEGTQLGIGLEGLTAADLPQQGWPRVHSRKRRDRRGL